MASILLTKVLAAPVADEAWFEGLLRWVMDGDPEGGLTSVRFRRLQELQEHLELRPSGPEWKARIQAVWSHTSAVGLLADAGLPTHGFFLREAVELLVDRR
ncbi:MAG: site-specific recombinase, partial [Holophaga sp.]|nr:site-specific recombinase [Holophaga sp.]